MTIFEAIKITEKRAKLTLRLQKVSYLQELLRHPKPNPSKKRHKNEHVAYAVGFIMKSKRPNTIIAVASQRQPIIRTRFAPIRNTFSPDQ